MDKKHNEIIRELREEAKPKLNQTEVAEKTGITQRKLSYIETGQSEPSIDDIKALCKFFDVSADYLLGITNERKPYPKA